MWGDPWRNELPHRTTTWQGTISKSWMQQGQIGMLSIYVLADRKNNFNDFFYYIPFKINIYTTRNMFGMLASSSDMQRKKFKMQWGWCSAECTHGLFIIFTQLMRSRSHSKKDLRGNTEIVQNMTEHKDFSFKNVCT